MSWTKATIKDRTKALRHATPKGDILETLFEMQNRICDLCDHPIQDLMLAALEHSTPVSWFAKTNLTLEEAIRQCNSPTNLRAAHATCNHIKLNKTRAEWFSFGLNKTVNRPHHYTVEEIETLREKLAMRGRATNATTHGRKGNGGRALGNQGGIRGGCAIRDRKIGIFADNFNRSAAGRKGGMANAMRKTGICGRSPEKMAADGRTNALQSIAKGTSMVLIPGMAAKANKIRWDCAFIKTVAYG